MLAIKSNNDATSWDVFKCLQCGTVGEPPTKSEEIADVRSKR
jgi:hypothetical protein